MNRKVKDIPKHFHIAKREFEKLLNTFWFSRKKEDGSRNESIENITLLYIMLQEFAKFAEEHQYRIGEELLNKMEENKLSSSLIYDYGKAVDFDKEASWLYIRNIDDKEWYDFDMKSNKEYLEKRGK